MGLPKPRPHSKLQTPHSKMTVAFEWVNIFECLKILVKADIHIYIVGMVSKHMVPFTSRGSLKTTIFVQKIKKSEL